ncbi:hypothetical protein ACE1OC_40810 [Streptomyces sp. DSM 116496]|uniref:hypothetical protein n=1 Tax=Streptomyces stoeckheimensis TaxID=3344656 RepID=UPI0038B39209
MPTAATPAPSTPEATPDRASIPMRACLRRSARAALTITVTAAVGLAFYREHFADPLAVAISAASLIGCLRRR